MIVTFAMGFKMYYFLGVGKHWQYVFHELHASGKINYVSNDHFKLQKYILSFFFKYIKTKMWYVAQCDYYHSCLNEVDKINYL